MVKNPLANAGNARDAGSIPGWGRSPGVGNGNPLQYSCLENSIDRENWWATAHGVTKSRTQLSIAQSETASKLLSSARQVASGEGRPSNTQFI